MHGLKKLSLFSEASTVGATSELFLNNPWKKL